MDLLGALHSNCTSNIRFMLLRSPILSGNIKNLALASCSLSGSSFRVDHLGAFDINLPKGGAFSSSRSFVVRAAGKKNSGNSNSNSSSNGKGDNSFEEDGSFKESNPISEGNTENNGGQKSHHKPLDWREFRASLYIQEQAAIAVSDPQKHDGTAFGFKPLPPKWAHPIAAPENGCLLVATEKLDGVRTFERSVVLLLKSGTSHPQEGPFGVVINRPLGKKMKHMKPTNLDLATTFADCSLHFGGPLEASMFLLRAEGKSETLRFEEVIPGVSFGARNSLEEASALVKKGVLKPQDFKFFFGYAGWQLDQLMEEIESDYWYVAACSANLILGASQISPPNVILGASQISPPQNLWKEILQLMGGHYSEVSRKPKQDL